MAVEFPKPKVFNVPKIRTTRQRRIPAGYIIGRIAGTHGDEQLIPFSELLRQLQATPAGTTLVGLLGGDVQGVANANTVTAIQGRSVASTAPTGGQVLIWNAGSNQWQPGLQTEWGSFIVIDSTHYYVAMVVSLADPEFVLSGGVPVYVLNPGFTP